jgi:hypothetical protein
VPWFHHSSFRILLKPTFITNWFKNPSAVCLPPNELNIAHTITPSHSGNLGLFLAWDGNINDTGGVESLADDLEVESPFVMIRLREANIGIIIEEVKIRSIHLTMAILIRAT